MEGIEQSVSSTVKSTADAIEKGLVRSIRLAALPFVVTIQLFKKSIPPALHLAVLLSLLPIIGLVSISAGYLVVSWLPTGWSQTAHLQYGQGVPPFAHVDIPRLSYQPYDISLHLVVPQTESNYALGNFMTTVTLMNTYNKTLSVSQRPALLVPSRGLLRTLSPILTTIVVPLWDSYTPSTTNIRAKIEVGRQDGWQSLGAGEGRELAVAEMHIKGIVKLSGIVKLLAKSQIITLSLTSSLFFLTSTFFMVLFYIVFAPSFSPDEDVPGTPGMGSRASDDGSKGQVSRRSRRSSVSSTSSMPRANRPAKTEEEEPVLRRRRSRRSQSPVPSSSRTMLS